MRNLYGLLNLFRPGRLGARLSTDPLIDAEEEELGFFADIWASVVDWWNELLLSYRGVDTAENGSMTTVFVILGLCLGIIAAIWIVTISRRRYGAFVRSLLHADATGPAAAKTLAELGFDGKKSNAVRRGLLHSVDLRRVVKCVGEEEALAAQAAAESDADKNAEGKEPEHAKAAKGAKEEPVFDLKAHLASGEARFYIREEDLYLAGSRYDVKAERLLTPILTTIASLVAMFLLLKWMPGILETAGGLVKNIGD